VASSRSEIFFVLGREVQSGALSTEFLAVFRGFSASFRLTPYFAERTRAGHKVSGELPRNGLGPALLLL
jgi:hypothetical protein